MSQDAELWFSRNAAGRIRAVSWKGRACLYAYALLVIVAVVTYRSLWLDVLVIGAYSLALVGVMVVKSDLVPQPEEGPTGEVDGPAPR